MRQIVNEIYTPWRHLSREYTRIDISLGTRGKRNELPFEIALRGAMDLLTRSRYEPPQISRRTRGIDMSLAVNRFSFVLFYVTTARQIVSFFFFFSLYSSGLLTRSGSKKNVTPLTNRFFSFFTRLGYEQRETSGSVLSTSTIFTPSSFLSFNFLLQRPLLHLFSYFFFPLLLYVYLYIFNYIYVFHVQTYYIPSFKN